MDWNENEEAFLQELAKNAQQLSMRYKQAHDEWKKKQNHLKIPSIVISTVAGVSSFGVSTFPVNAQHIIPIIVGALNIFTAILSSLESFFKMNEMIIGSMEASTSFQRLHDNITTELSILPASHRSSNGLNYLRESQQEYESILNKSPINILKRMRFIKPSSDVMIEISGSESDTPKDTILSRLKNII